MSHNNRGASPNYRNHHNGHKRKKRRQNQPQISVRKGIGCLCQNKRMIPDTLWPYIQRLIDHANETAESYTNEGLMRKLASLVEFNIETREFIRLDDQSYERVYQNARNLVLDYFINNRAEDSLETQE